MIASSDEPQISADELDALEKGFYSETRDPHGSFRRLAESIDSMGKQWQPVNFMCPISAVVQSSGVGKSRSIKELADTKFVVHLCLRGRSDGFPLRSFKVSDILLTEPETNYPRHEALSRFVAYICACYEELTEFLHKESSYYLRQGGNKERGVQQGGSKQESIFRKWYDQQIATHVMGNKRHGGKEFWGRVCSRMTVIQGNLLVPLKENPSDSVFARNLKEKVKTATQKLEDQFKALHSLQKGSISIVFAIDEARSLLVSSQKLGDNTLYHYFRIASALIPGYDSTMKANVFALLLDTVSKVANFLPSSIADPSFRYITKSTNLYSPYWTIDLWDVLAVTIDRDSLLAVHRGSTPLNEFLREFFRQGRVLWGRTLDDFRDTESPTAAVLRAITSAKCKLMGGINFEDDIKQDPRRVIIDQNMIALWCVRASLLVKPQGELASDLIANRLGVCLAVSQNRKTVYVGYSSEPLVAEAAARILNHSKIKFGENLEPLISFIREGLVEPGPKGELTVRILLTLAWDHAIHKKQEGSPDFMYTCPLTVKEYLSALMVDLSSLEGQISSENLQVLFNGVVFFTHFIAIERGITKESLHCFFCRGAAIQCQRGQTAIDHGIPVLLANGEFTYIIIQTRNYNLSDPNVTFASTVITPQAAGLDDNPKLPYLVLYFSLGYKRGEIKNLKRVEQRIQGDKQKTSKRQAQLEQALANEDIVIAKSRADYQLIVGLFGITEDVYPFLHVDSNSKHKLSRSSLSKKELLQKLSKTWTDPMSCAEGDKKEVMKRMMPLVWEGGVRKKINASGM